MRSNSARIILLAALLAGLNPPVRAVPPEPTATPEASQTPTPGAISPKVSFIRLWYVGGAKSPRITASLKAGDGEPQVIGSHVRAGRLGSYRMFIPGPYSFVIMDGNVVPDATGKLPTNIAPVTIPASVSLKPGAFHTLVVEEQAGRIVSTVIHDTPPKPETGPQLRVFDYTGSTSDSLRLSCGEQELPIWNSSNPTPFQKSLSGLHGLARLELMTEIDGKPKVVNVYEATIESKNSYSLVIFVDRYGQKAFTFVEDAAASFTKAEIEAFMKEH